MNLTLLWEENFQLQQSLDPKHWNLDLGDGSDRGIPGWGNNELENYTSDSLNFNDGLVFTASRYKINEGPLVYYGKAEWKSAKIHTLGKMSFKYGRMQIRAKAPTGEGTWPAIWMLGENLGTVGWPNCGEIDIFEGAGNRPHEACGTLHGPGFAGDKGIGVAKEFENPLSDSFHDYAIDWLPDQIKWSIDGEVYSTISSHQVNSQGSTWPFNNSFYLIINLAIGGWFGGEVSDSLTSANFHIESIKYFSIDGIGELGLRDPNND